MAEPSPKNQLNRYDVVPIVVGTLVAGLVAMLTYLIGLGDDLEKMMCGLGELPCKMAPALIPLLGFLLTAVQKFRAGEPKPPSEPTP